MRNLKNPLVSQVSTGLDDPAVDESHLTWDGNGDVLVGFQFNPNARPLFPGEGQQEARVRLRKTSPGGADVNFHLLIEEDGFQHGPTGFSIAGYNNTDWHTLSWTWDALGLSDMSGKNVIIVLKQVSGGGGNPSRRRGIEVSGVEWVAKSDGPNPLYEVLRPVALV